MSAPLGRLRDYPGLILYFTPALRAVAAASVARAKAADDERSAMARELAHPPTGLPLAVWHAYVASESETGCGARVEVRAADIAALRRAVELGVAQIGGRILAGASQAYDNGGAVRYGRGGR